MNLVRIESPLPAPIESWVAGQWSANTQRAYRADIPQFLEFIGRADLSQIRREEIVLFRSWLVEDRHYEPATVNRKLSAVRSMFREFVQRGLLERSPAEGIKGHKRERDYARTKCLSLDQVQSLLDATASDDLPGLRDHAIIYVMASLGLRREEVSRLNASSLVDDGGGKALEVFGKGDKRRRLAVPATTVQAVDKWLGEANLPPDGPLFPRLIRNHGLHIGGRLTPNGVWHIIRQRLRQCRLTGFSPHSFRHFAITYYLGKGMDLWRVQRLAGHSDPSTTQLYNQARGDRANSAAEYCDF